MSRKLKSKAKKKESCYPFFDRYVEAFLKEERMKKRRSYPKDKKDLLALYHSAQPKKNIPLSKADVKKAKASLRKKRVDYERKTNAHCAIHKGFNP